jgi:hypothetical protein
VRGHDVNRILEGEDECVRGYRLFFWFSAKIRSWPDEAEFQVKVGNLQDVPMVYILGSFMSVALLNVLSFLEKFQTGSLSKSALTIALSLLDFSPC